MKKDNPLLEKFVDANIDGKLFMLYEETVSLKGDVRKLKNDIKWLKKLFWGMFVAIFITLIGVVR